MYYTYGHIRPDTGVVFYVGKGSKKRAYNRQDRNNHWHNIVNKNNGQFEVKIFNWFNTEQHALNSEIWQIAQLSSFGNLVNQTPGGENPPRLFGDLNPMKNPEIAKKTANSLRGRQKTTELKIKISEARKGKGVGERNAMKRPEVIALMSGVNHYMSNYEHIEKRFSNNPTKGKRNGMFGKTGDKNPAYGKPSAMRGKKNLGLAWVAENKTWQHYWGA